MVLTLLRPNLPYRKPWYILINNLSSTSYSKCICVKLLCCRSVSQNATNKSWKRRINDNVLFLLHDSRTRLVSNSWKKGKWILLRLNILSNNGPVSNVIKFKTFRSLYDQILFFDFCTQLMGNCNHNKKIYVEYFLNFIGELCN